MNRWTTIVVATMLAGCAGANTAPSRDSAVGHWSGRMELGAWSQPLALQIDDEAGTYRGEWVWGSGLASQRFETVAVRGDAVRLETQRLVFVGLVRGSTLSGTVSNKRTEAPEGEFSVTHDGDGYSPGSEPSFLGITR
jgi:hypothetical protein